MIQFVIGTNRDLSGQHVCCTLEYRFGDDNQSIVLKRVCAIRAAREFAEEHGLGLSAIEVKDPIVNRLAMGRAG